jgi:hypothetical protein
MEPYIRYVPVPVLKTEIQVIFTEYVLYGVPLYNTLYGMVQFLVIKILDPDWIRNRILIGGTVFNKKCWIRNQ